MKNTLLKARQQMGSRAPPPEMIAFTAAGGFAMRMAMEFQSVALSLDLSRQADALRITFAFASENGAAFIGSFLALLEPSVTEALAMMQEPPAPGAAPAPAAAPAAPPSAPAAPPDPVYRAVFQGKEAHVTMAGATLDRIIGTVAGLISAGKQPPDRPPFPMPGEGPDEE
jgi:hypothetical protein